MRESAQYWLFVDSRTRTVSRRLSQHAAEEFIRNLRNVNIEYWWAWNPCFRDWIPLKNIIDFHEGKVRMLIQLPEPGVATVQIDDVGESERSERTKIPEEYSQVRDFLREEAADDLRDFHGDDLTVSRIPKPPALGFNADRRQSHRVQKRIEVLIAGRGKSFRAYTVNISLTGLMLDQALPFEMQGGPFEIVFIFQSRGVKKQLAFQGRVSGDMKDRRRLMFGDLSPKSQVMLQEIFAA